MYSQRGHLAYHLPGATFSLSYSVVKRLPKSQQEAFDKGANVSATHTDSALVSIILSAYTVDVGRHE